MLPYSSCRPTTKEAGHTEKTSTLLVDNKLRKEYEKLHVKVDAAKELLLHAMKEESGDEEGHRKRNIIDVYGINRRFISCLDSRAAGSVGAETDTMSCALEEYDKVFDDKVLKALATKDLASVIADYVTKYNELLDASTYLQERHIQLLQRTSQSPQA